MQKIVNFGLYTALAVMANMALANPAADLREGDMQKLVFHEAPMASSEAVFFAEDGQELTLADYAGKITLVNFWATWCAPCRAEMPTLSGLQEALGGEGFEVLTVATGRNDRAGMERFFDEIGVENLPMHTDPKQALARSMGVLGLPITVILDREGREIARLQGDADWNSPSAQAVLHAVIAQ